MANLLLIVYFNMFFHSFSASITAFIKKYRPKISVMTSKMLNHQDYSVGWVCALTKKLVVPIVMSNKRHPNFLKPTND